MKKESLPQAETDQILKLSKSIAELDKNLSVPTIIEVFMKFEEFLGANGYDEILLKVNDLHTEFIYTRLPG